VEFPEYELLISYFLLARFNNQAGTKSAIFSMLTGLIRLHFDKYLPKGLVYSLCMLISSGAWFFERIYTFYLLMDDQ